MTLTQNQHIPCLWAYRRYKGRMRLPSPLYAYIGTKDQAAAYAASYHRAYDEIKETVKEAVKAAESI